MKTRSIYAILLPFIIPALAYGNLVNNPSMEGTFVYQDPLGDVAEYWTGWRGDVSPLANFNESTTACFGSKSQEIHWNGAGYELFGPDGIYQQIGTLQIGESYRALFWFKLRFEVGGYGIGLTDGHGDITCSIGIDPNGGTDPGAVANWSSVSETVWAWEHEGDSDAYDGPWLNAPIFFSPNGGSATIFIRVHGRGDAMTMWEEPECPEPPCEHMEPAVWFLYCYIDDVAVDLAEIGQGSTIEATSPVPANGANYSEVTITVHDPNGNPIADIPPFEIVVESTGSGNTIIGPDSPTDENGRTTARITSTVAETKTISAIVVGTQLSDTATVEFGEGYFGPDWYVDASNIGYWNGSSEHPFRSISEAIIPAQDSDTLIVYPGTYTENIDFSGKAITIRSTDPNDLQVVQATVINGGGNDSVVLFKNSEGADSVLSGFTITGGQAYRGGGIYCWGSASPTITNNTITNNTASSSGGGIYGGSNSIIKNNIIMGNAAAYGGGISNCDGTISNCVIINNNAMVWPGDGGGLYNCDGYIVNSIIAMNKSKDDGGGLYHCDGNIVNCTIVDNNTVNYNGGGLRSCNGTITNCIIWNNTSHDQSCQLYSCSIPTYSCIEGGCSGEGCIDSDPHFVDPSNGDYHLQPWSPCIDAGTNDPPGGLPATDIEGTNRLLDGNEDGTVIADMGAYECLPHPELHIQWHRPSGSVIGPVEHIEVKFDEPINGETFTEEDVVIIRPDGARVPLAGQSVHQGGNIWRVHFQPQSLIGQYELQVGPQIEDLDGNEMDQDVDHVPGEISEDRYIGTFVIEGPKIIEHSPVGTKRGPINSISFIFDHPMDTNSFSPSEDIISFTGPEGGISVTGACWIDPCVLEVTFEVQYIAGEYEMVVGPYILNIASNPLDQDGDGVAGESPDDHYGVSFALTYWSGHASGTWRLSPVIVDGPLRVGYNSVLRIEPGVVVKFLNSSAKIDVQCGFLEARGTVDEPVILTSFKDDSADGDTNRDANSTEPYPGDWYGIDFSPQCQVWFCLYLTSRAFLENVEIRYASKAIDADYLYAKVQLRNVALRDGNHGVYVYQPYSQVKAENCLIANNKYAGIFVRADSRHIFRNCTIVGNGFGGSGRYSAGVHLGGADLTLDNCIVAFNKNGLHHSDDPPAVTVRHCDFYNPAGQEIIWDGDPGEPQLDQNGNTIGDPNFVDYNTGNYELADGSPAIDSGRGIHAPYQDILGRDRYDDRGMFNIGTGYPCYIDIGAFERQQDTAAGDLAVTVVSAPDPEIVSASDSFTVEWTVANIGTLDCNNPWQDAVYLSDDPYFSSDDFVLESRDHNEPLIPGASYTETLTAMVPAVSGPQYVLVRTDSNESLLEAAQVNNEGFSSDVLAVDVPLLEIGVPQAGTASHGEWSYYRFEGQPGRTVRFTLDSAVGTWQLYLRRALPPTMSAYDVAGAALNQAYQEIRLLEPTEGTYYVGVYAQWLPGGPTNYTLYAELTELDIRRVSPEVVGNTGQATIKMEGDNFDPNAQVQLNGPGGAIDGEEWYQDTTMLFATFDLAGACAATGLYDIVVTNPGPESVTAHDVLTIEEGGVAEFTANLVVPGLARPGRTIKLRIEYANTGDVDLPSPLVRLQAGAKDYQWQLPGRDDWFVGADVYLMALSSEGPAGLLRPHQAESLVIKLQIPFRPHDVRLELDALANSATHWADAVDWDTILGEPDSSISDPNTWRAFSAELSTVLGATWESVITNIASHANDLLIYDCREHSVETLLGDFVMSSLCSTLTDGELETFTSSTSSISRADLGTLQPHDGEVDDIRCVNRDTPDHEKPDIVVIHGWKGNPNRGGIKDVIDNLKYVDSRGDIQANLIVVDWHTLAYPGELNYSQACRNTDIVGREMAQWYVQHGSLATPMILIVHSLADRVAHRVSENLVAMGIARPDVIWRLDPAVRNGAPTERLDATRVITLRGSLLGLKEATSHLNINIKYPDDLTQIERHIEVPSTFADWLLINARMVLTGTIQDALPTAEWQAFDTFGVRLDLTPEDLRELLRENDFDIWWSDEWILPEAPLEEYLQTKFSVMTSFTPEDKFGPGGYDAPGTPGGSKVRYVPAGRTFNYRIEFWNKEDAPVPTQDAIIEDVLDLAVFDLSTFEFTRFGFLKWDVPLSGTQVIDTRIDCRPDMDIAVEVTGNFDPESGKIDWWFHCVDPMTGDYPEDPMAGFLPPYNPETGYEIGWVEFRVKPKPDLPSGTQIANQAFVEFDFAGDLYDHPAPKEGPWINTIDACAPSSYVLPLPATPPEPNFVVEWTGQDNIGGSGIVHYDIYVSVDGGDYVLWLNDTTETSAVFHGEDGHSYAFYSVAYDNVGSAEEAPTEPDAIVTFNRAPVANAGPDQIVERSSYEGAEVILDGSDSNDPDGDPLTYEWTWAGGSAVDINPTVILPSGLTTVTLTVSDGQLSDTDTVDISVVDTTPPEVPITVPQANVALQDGVTLTSEASDISGVAEVYFYVREPDDANGAPIGYEDLPGTLNASSGKWGYAFDTTQLPDGYYVILARAVDTYGNEGWSEVVPFSIRNWAVLELLPATRNNNPGRTMPVKFSLRIVESVDPTQPFVYNEELEIRIYDSAYPSTILQTSLYGDYSTDYRINSLKELYITNFKTKKEAAEYIVEIWRINKDFLVGSFTFETVDLGNSDLTGEGRVDIEDLFILAGDWLQSNSITDIAPSPNGDGIVNFLDFAVLASHWLESTE